MARAAWPSRAPPRAPAGSPGVARRPPRPTPAAHVVVPSRFLHRRALSSRRRADRLVLASTGWGAGSGSGGAGGGGRGRGGRPGGGGGDADEDADDDDDDGDDDARGRGGRGGRSRPPRAPSFALAGAAAGRASPDAADARAEEEEAASATLRASDSSPRSPPRISVSIVIPALNEELAIGRVLRNLECLDPPPLEVIVAVGDSQDATEALAKRFAEDRKRLRRVRKGLLEEETVTETATERRPGRDAARRRGRFWSSRSPNPKNPDPGEKKTTTPPPSGLEPASSGSEPPSLTNTNTNVTSPPPPPSCRHAWDVRTVRSRRGRASQMNAGAALARGDALLFLHADTFVPDDVVALVAGSLTPFEQPSNDLRTTFERPFSGPTNGEEERTVVAGGFASLIEHDRRTFWGMSAHNVAKTFYAPLLFRPLSFARGLRVLFGDQAMFVRAEEFRRVGGFDEALPIMEDADLCVRLHDAGPARRTARTKEGLECDEKGLECDGKWRYHTFREGAGGVVSPGGSASDEWSTRPFKPRVKPVGLHGRGSIVLVDRAVRTSGRRVDALGGNLKATAVHFLIGLSWYFGATPEDMVSLYRRFYEDVR